MMLLRHVANISRYQDVGTNGRRQLAPLYRSVACLALPMDASPSVSHQFSLARGYDIFFRPGQDVREGDRVVIGTRQYSVKGVQLFDVPRVGHVRALCEQEVT